MVCRGETPITSGPLIWLGLSIRLTRPSMGLLCPCYGAVLVRRTEDRTLIDVKDQAGPLVSAERALCIEGQAVEWIGSWTSTRGDQGIQH
jgi:hypothetical protein